MSNNLNHVIHSWGKVKELGKTDLTATREITVKSRGCMPYMKNNNSSKLWLITKGTLNIIIEDEPVELSQFNVIVVPSGKWHTGYVLAEQESVTILETSFSKNMQDKEKIETKPLPSFSPVHVGYNGI